jgi:hypothetical protein
MPRWPRLAVTGATRVNVLPDVPPVSDFVPGYEASGWQASALTGIRPLKSSTSSTRKSMQDSPIPRMKARIADLSYTVFASSPAEFAAYTAFRMQAPAKAGLIPPRGS